MARTSSHVKQQQNACIHGMHLHHLLNDFREMKTLSSIKFFMMHPSLEVICLLCPSRCFR